MKRRDFMKWGLMSLASVSEVGSASFSGVRLRDPMLKVRRSFSATSISSGN